MGMLTDDQWTRIEAGIRAVGIRGGKPRADDGQTNDVLDPRGFDRYLTLAMLVPVADQVVQ